MIRNSLLKTYNLPPCKSHLHLAGEPEGDLLVGGGGEDGRGLVPVLVVAGVGVGVGQDLGRRLVLDIAGARALRAHPEEGIGTWRQ